jgi:hypothetical protein
MVGRLPRGEVVVGEQLCADLHLPGHKVDRRPRHVFAPREPRLMLEVLQQQREPQPRRPGLVRQQGELLLVQRPARDQILEFPLAPHLDAFLPNHTQDQEKT